MSYKTSSAAPLPPPFPRVSDYVDWYAEHTPDLEAMVYNDQRFSYLQLRENLDQLARALLKAGVKKGDRVATLCPPSPDYFITFLATISIGAIWVGLNPRYQLNELKYVTGDSEPVVLFSRANIGQSVHTGIMKATQSIQSLVILDANSADMPAMNYRDFISAGECVSRSELEQVRQNCGGRDPCMIVYTSGSTGKPKGALLHHQGIVEVSLGQNRLWPVSPLRMLNYFPINHVGCVVDVSTPTLVSGGTIVFLDQFFPRRSLELMESERITLWGSVPSVFQLQFAEQDFDSFDLSAVQLIAWGGAAMPQEMISRLLKYGCPLATNYSMSESCGSITAQAPTFDISLLENTVGQPFEGVDIRLIDHVGQEVGKGESGEIQIRSDYNMLGYWRAPEATAQSFSPEGWFFTGDLGRENPDGSYSIVGRVKEMYKSGGYNVYPREIENVIESFPGVNMAAVVSTEDPVWQEVGVAYVLSDIPIDISELITYCRSQLANYKLPKKIIMLDEMPLLPIGKIDKLLLKERAIKDYGSNDPAI